MTVLHPEVLWAQRSSETDDAKNVLYVTVNLPDIIESTLEYNLTPTAISFKAKTGNVDKGIAEKEFALDLDFFSEVVPEESSKRLTSRSFILHLRKKEKNLEYWPRLQKAKLKSNFIKTDFSKWVDEDEQDEKPIAADDTDMEGMGGMGGMPGMGGMGGMPGMGGMGGMPGMGGMGGMPGGMGGMPGMGGMGGMGMPDIQKMMAEMGGAGNIGLGEGSSGTADEDDSDEDGPPPLEEA